MVADCCAILESEGINDHTRKEKDRAGKGRLLNNMVRRQGLGARDVRGFDDEQGSESKKGIFDFSMIRKLLLFRNIFLLVSFI